MLQTPPLQPLGHATHAALHEITPSALAPQPPHEAAVEPRLTH
jgi:hypothetical protein